MEAGKEGTLIALREAPKKVKGLLSPKATKPSAM